MHAFAQIRGPGAAKIKRRVQYPPGGKSSGYLITRRELKGDRDLEAPPRNSMYPVGSQQQVMMGCRGGIQDCSWGDDPEIAVNYAGIVWKSVAELIFRCFDLPICSCYDTSVLRFFLVLHGDI